MKPNELGRRLSRETRNPSVGTRISRARMMRSWEPFWKRTTNQTRKMRLSWTMIPLREMSPTILPRKPPGVEVLRTSLIWRLLTGFRRGESLKRRLLRGLPEDQSTNGLPKVLNPPRNGLIPGFSRQLPLSKEHLPLLPGERGQTPLARAPFPKRRVHVPLRKQSSPPPQETRTPLTMRDRKSVV